MMNNRLIARESLILVLLCSCTTLAFAAAEAEESGRDMAMDFVDEGSLVAGSFLDAESVIDDYGFPYAIPEGDSFAVFVESDKPLSYVWGDTITVQVAVATNSEEFFAEQPFNYVLFFNDPGILDEDSAREAIARTLRSLVAGSGAGQDLFIYLHADERLVQVTSYGSALAALREAASKEWTASPDRTLEALLRTADEELEGESNRFLWLLGRPIANQVYGFDRVSTVITALRGPETEISYCGFSDALRPRTVNELVRSFGGNSYYIADASELPDIIERDFDFYARPALSDLRIRVHALGGNPQPQAVREYRRRSIGADEHNTILARILVPSLAGGASVAAGGAGQPVQMNVPSTANLVNLLPVEQPIALVDYQYTDRRDGSLHRGSRVVTVSYTADYDEYVGAWNYRVIKNTAAVATFATLADVAQFVRYRGFDQAILHLDAQVELLRQLLHFVDDPLIPQDIAFLSAYKRQILELKRDPNRSQAIADQLGWGQR